MTLTRLATETVGTYDYSAFGTLKSQTGADACRFKFSSKERDASTGFSYYGYRFYAPQWQRWLNRDPLGEPGFEVIRGYSTDVLGDGPNTYLFSGNRPTEKFDAEGLDALGWLDQIRKAWDKSAAIKKCKKAMEEWRKECINGIPKCAMADLNGNAKGKCPYDEPGQDPSDHWVYCEANRIEGLAKCAKGAQAMFEDCKKSAGY